MERHIRIFANDVLKCSHQDVPHQVIHPAGMSPNVQWLCRKPFFLADLGVGVCKSALKHLGSAGHTHPRLTCKRKEGSDTGII